MALSSCAVLNFASDNYAPALPEAIAAIAAANHGPAVSYGADPWTARLQERVREQFGEGAVAFPVFNGTGANVTGLRALLKPWQGVICAETAHLNVDGKLTPELASRRLVRFGDEHASQPGAISVTQSTELGTVYTPDELRALAELAHAHGMAFHIDGSRLANAAASLGVALRAIATDVGADVVSLGGTKAGLVLGEAVIVLRGELADPLRHLRKQSMQLASKMRFISAQLEALLTAELWRRAAGHANAMARRLGDAVAGLEGVVLTQPVQANGVFAILPPGAAERLQEDFHFYFWDERTREVRWMCAWDTREEDVDAFAAAVAEQVAHVGAAPS
jgi:threonine aldolase